MCPVTGNWPKRLCQHRANPCLVAQRLPMCDSKVSDTGRITRLEVKASRILNALCRSPGKPRKVRAFHASCSWPLKLNVACRSSSGEMGTDAISVARTRIIESALPDCSDKRAVSELSGDSITCQPKEQARQHQAHTREREIPPERPFHLAINLLAIHRYGESQSPRTL